MIIFKIRVEQKLFQMRGGKVINSPKLADIEQDQCRTQVTISLEREFEPIGNHYLVCQATAE